MTAPQTGQGTQPPPPGGGSDTGATTQGAPDSQDGTSGVLAQAAQRVANGGTDGDGTTGTGDTNTPSTTEGTQPAGITDAQLDALVERLVPRIEQEANRVSDRRINQLVDRLNGRKGHKGSDGDDTDSSDTSNRPDRTIVRGARLALREYLDTEVSFLDGTERGFYLEEGFHLIGEAITDAGDSADEDRIGKRIAKELGRRVRDRREYYERWVRNELKRAGALQPDNRATTSTPPSGTQANAQSFEAGAALAKRIVPGRFSQE